MRKSPLGPKDPRQIQQARTLKKYLGVFMVFISVADCVGVVVAVVVIYNKQKNNWRPRGFNQSVITKILTCPS